MSATTSATAPATSTIAPPVAAQHWYRLAVLLLGLALVAMTALTLYLAATRTTAVAGETTSYPSPGTSQGEPCLRPGVPC